MLFRKSPEKFFNLVATKYAASPITDSGAYEKKIARLKSYLLPDNRVLDVGCGTGTQCDDLAYKVYHVTGIDISSKLLAIAEQRRMERNIENVTFIQTGVFDKRFTRDSFDVVMAFYVLRFFADIDLVMRRIHELLIPGGLFILETACLGENNKFMGKCIRLAGQLGLLPLISLLTTRQLELALREAGFVLQDKIRFSSSNNEYTLIARKG